MWTEKKGGDFFVYLFISSKVFINGVSLPPSSGLGIQEEIILIPMAISFILCVLLQSSSKCETFGSIHEKLQILLADLHR